MAAASSSCLKPLPILHKSTFFGQKSTFLTLPHKPLSHKPPIPGLKFPKLTAKFDLFELLGGRGICNGEEGLQKELQNDINSSSSSTRSEGGFDSSADSKAKSSASAAEGLPDDAFEKELLGLTGGFPGGEKGLMKFIEKNPPPAAETKKQSEEAQKEMIQKKQKMT